MNECGETGDVNPPTNDRTLEAEEFRERIVDTLLNLEYFHLDQAYDRGRWAMILVGVVLIVISVLIVVVGPAMLHTPIHDNKQEDTTGAVLGFGLSGVVLTALGWWFIASNRKGTAIAYARLRVALYEACENWPGAPTNDASTNDSLQIAAWHLVRWLEETHQGKAAHVTIVSPGRLWMECGATVFLDKRQIGVGEEESGFDIRLDVCFGRHLLELRSGKQRWRAHFVIPVVGHYIVEIVGLRREAILLEAHHHTPRWGDRPAR